MANNIINQFHSFNKQQENYNNSDHLAMAGGGAMSTQGVQQQFPGKVTGYVVISCLVAATGGLLFGYDIGIAGGVTSMDPFLIEFFPNVYKKQKEAGGGNMYCKFDDHLLQLFTSSLYLAALVASFFASMVTKSAGRRASMLIGGCVFFAGAALNACAINLAMLIIGRILLGIGVGFANQSIPVYLSEMAPSKYRGAFNMCFQMACTIGIFVANLINLGTTKIKGGWGWRLSLGLAAVPAIIITVGAIFLPDTPNSMIERGLAEEARVMLTKIRGTQDVGAEYQDLIDASEAAKRIDDPWKNIGQPRYTPELTFCILIPFFQQVTGINVINFYAPVLYKTLGFGDDVSLLNAVVSGAVNLVATLVSIFTADRFGRRVLFLEGGVQMLVCQVLVAVLIAISFGSVGVGSMPKPSANGLLALICIYVAGFAWSWGPLGWLVPSEICPLEIRSSGQAINVAVNMLFTFLVGQFFLSMLCHMKFGLFLFFAGWVVIMTLFIGFFLPETKGVPIEEVYKLWKAHWFWSKYVNDENDGHPQKDIEA